MDKTGVLQKFSFYREAPPPLRGKIAEEGAFAALPAGATFYREGETCENFAVVGRGNLRVFKTAESGREMTLYHVQDGQPCLVNMLCILLGRPAMATAVVEDPTEAVVVHGATFRDWVHEQPAMRSYVFETMAERLAEVMNLAEEIAFGKMDRRVAGLLVQRFSGNRAFAATHEEIAVELGTAREVVSRLLKDFERMGAIAMARGRLELRNASLLRDLADRS